jgi:hypothetical protein
MYLDAPVRRTYTDQNLTPIWKEGSQGLDGLGQWLTIAATLLPIVLQSAPTVIGLFKKGKPQLTELQVGALQRLPDPFLGLAVAELEASDNMKDDFEDIYAKYVKKAVAQKKIDNAKNSIVTTKRMTTIGLIVGGTILASIAVVALSRR